MLIAAVIGLATPHVIKPQFLEDVRTPAFVVDTDAVLACTKCDLNTLFTTASREELQAVLAGSSYLHARVSSIAPRHTPYHKDATYPLATFDCLHSMGGPNVYLSMGLNNHYDAGYYFARSAGAGARLAAPGVAVRPGPEGIMELVRLPEAEAAALNPAAGFQTNDGKRSEWCEFLRRGDEVDLIPTDPLSTLSALGGKIVGVRRSGRPLGAEPVVSGFWTWRNLAE